MGMIEKILQPHGEAIWPTAWLAAEFSAEDLGASLCGAQN